MASNIEDESAKIVTTEKQISKTEALNSELNSLHINNDKTGAPIDIADLEYDEDFASLVAEQEIEDFSSLIMEETKIGNGQFTPDNLIDEDFEAELGSQAHLQENIMESDLDKKKNQIKERIDRYGIVNVCGSDNFGRPIIVISACKLPDESLIQKEKEFFTNQQHFFDTLLEVLSTILEQYVESEYTLVYLHYGLKGSSQPSFNWLGKVYKMLDRKFKKNLKALFIVHPTTLIKILWNFLSTLISSKFSKKVHYCKNLDELAVHIDLSILKIPDEVKLYDLDLKLKKKSVKNSPSLPAQLAEIGPFQQFKVSLEIIAAKNNGDCIPLCVKETMVFLRQNLDEEGIFRKAGSFERIRQIQTLYNDGQPVAYDTHEVHVAACVLKAFFRELPESLLSDSIFNEMMSLQALDLTDKVDVAKDLLSQKLPAMNYKLLECLIRFLAEVSSKSSVNKMDAKNLSYVFGPNFLRQKEGASYGLIDIERVNNFVELLIKYHSEIFS